jgi:hypothetical protein
MLAAEHKVRQGMRLPRIIRFAAATALAACGTGSTAGRDTAPGGEPSTETQQVAFALIKTTLECFGKNRPVHQGKVVLVGAFSAPGSPVEVYDSESTPGNEAAIACSIKEGSRQRSPQVSPSRFVRYYIVFPGSPEDIRIDFPTTAPSRKAF